VPESSKLTTRIPSHPGERRFSYTRRDGPRDATLYRSVYLYKLSEWASEQVKLNRFVVLP